MSTCNQRSAQADRSKGEPANVPRPSSDQYVLEFSERDMGAMKLTIQTSKGDVAIVDGQRR